MDEEDEQNSRGAYDNMAGPDIRPNFVASALNNSAQNLLRKSEDSASEAGSTADKNVSEKVADGVKDKAAEKALDAATGGVGGKIYSAAKKTGLIDNALSQTPGKSTGKAKFKKALPTMLVGGLVLGALVFGVIGSSFLTGLGKAISALFKEKDTSVAYNHTITDFQINNAQLGNATGSSEYGETVFDNMSFSDYQIESFRQAGLEYTEVDGEKALVHTNYDSSKTYYVSDAAITGHVYVDESIGDAGLLVTDSGAEGKTREERITELAILLGAKAEDKVEPFSNISKNFAAKNEYIAATDSYRGGQGAWGSQTASQTQDTLGINLNTWKDWNESPDNDANKEGVIRTIASKTAKNGGGSDTKSVSREELEELVEGSVKASKSEGCGYDSAAVVAGSVVNAAETVEQMNIGAAVMEADDKTIAGFGNKAPLNALLNIISEAGGLATESMRYLFSGSQTKINQDSEIILNTNAQANLGETGNPGYNNLGDEKTEAETCVYVNNTNSHDGKGFIETVRGMFTKVKGWITNIADKIKGFFGEQTEGATSLAVSAIEPAVARFNQMLEKSNDLGNADESIGEVLYTSVDRITNKMFNSVTATMAGDTNAVKTAYRAQQEVIAEKAEYDRTTKSPLDTSSRHTFLGSIAYSLIPFVTSNTATSLSSAISSFGTVLKNAATSILPTSSALSETSLELNYGDCVFGNSVGAFASANCVNPQTFDKQSVTRVSANIFNDVANLRKDEGGYIYGINADEVAPGEYSEYGDYSDFYIDFDRNEGHITDITEYKDGTGRAKSDVDYGNIPTNEAENELPSHWGTGGKEGINEPHGCESDWQYQILPRRDENGNLILEKDENGIEHKIYYRRYDFSKPSEWKYSRLTNFEYVGYKTGWPNLTSASNAGSEGAKNDEDPGTCMLDLKTDYEKQPVVNLNGALYMFIQMNGQRTSELGVSDQANAELLANTDFIHGRLNPCSEAIANRTERVCTEFTENENGWSGDPDEVAKDPRMSRWISGSAYVNYSGADTSLIKKGYETEEIFKDPTRGGEPFVNEMYKYSAYVSLIEWMDANNLLTRSGSSIALARHYDEHPLDNSYAGIIARYSGYKKETVVAVLDLFDYMEFLASYDPTDLYPLGPKSNLRTIIYDNPEIIATIEPAIDNQKIVFDELRNRTVTV